MVHRRGLLHREHTRAGMVVIVFRIIVVRSIIFIIALVAVRGDVLGQDSIVWWPEGAQCVSECDGEGDTYRWEEKQLRHYSARRSKTCFKRSAPHDRYCQNPKKQSGLSSENASRVTVSQQLTRFESESLSWPPRPVREYSSTELCV